MFPAKDSDTTVSENVFVAVKAEKEISRTALAWALTHIVRPGDCVTLLAVISNENRGRRLWNIPIFGKDWRRSHQERSPDRMCQISESFSQMVFQFHDQNQVGVRIKVVPAGAVATEAKRAGAYWVVLDKQLKHEEKKCIEELHCNIVVMKRSQAIVLRLNLGSSNELQHSFNSSLMPDFDMENIQSNRIKHSTPVSSPEDLKTYFTRTTAEETSVSSSDAGTSPFFICEQNPLFEEHKKVKPRPIYEQFDTDYPVESFDLEETFGLLTANSISSRTHNNGNIYLSSNIRNNKNISNAKCHTSRILLEEFVDLDREARIQRLGFVQTNQIDHVFNSDVRDAVSLNRTSSAPPPLCSLCHHKAPVFGKPPRWFSYRELEDATDGFSEDNFVAEGGYGLVHRGVLKDGQVVAVKQLKVAGSQGDTEFCKKVGVLSCAQHRNVVMLIGFCVEGRKRVLVYEYVCNGSLDSHLYGGRRPPLDWHSRLKIATGTARGLRYLHEDCRVGCIVHRDVRPNNILLTHDFEPLVRDFGLTTWQPELDLDAEPVIGTLGYLAPEYTEGAKITEKADVYAFGMVLLELITGQKTIDMIRHHGQQFLAEWSRPLIALEEERRALAINCQLLDPCLETNELHVFTHQIRAMTCAAYVCLCQDPDSRPPMSKVLRILEGGDAIIPLVLDSDPIGSRSGRLHGLSSKQQVKSRGNHSRRLSH